MVYAFVVAFDDCKNSAAQPRGPIEIPTDYPLTDVHLSLPSSSPDPTANGQRKFSLQLSWSNVSNYDVEGEQGEADIPTCDESRKSCFIVDTEIVKALFRYRVGLAEDVEALAYIPVVWRGGGTLDNFVDDFHKLIGVSTGVRGQVKEDQFTIKGRDEDSSFEFDDDGVALGNIVLGAKKSVRERSHSRTSMQALVSLPTSRGSYGHKGIDISGSLLHRESFHDFALYLGGGPVIKSDTSHYDVEYRRLHGEGFASLEYIYGPKLSLILGVHASTRIVEGIAEHPGTAAYLDTGLKTELYGLEWDVLFRENISSGSGTTDFAMVLGATLVY